MATGRKRYQVEAVWEKIRNAPVPRNEITNNGRVRSFRASRKGEPVLTDSF
jgi:hypothetical protein